MVVTRITLHKGKNKVADGCVRRKASVRTHVADVFVIRRVDKQELLEFIIPCGTKKWIILGELRQYFLEFFAMHKTGIPLVNVTKDFRREGIKIHTNFLRPGFFSRASGQFKGWRVLELEDGITS